MVNLPEEFEMKMKKLLGSEYEEFLASYDHPRNFGLRVNVDKISPKEFEKIAPFHLTKIPWTENGYYYEEQDMPARHPFYYAGMYYLQEPSAMTPDPGWCQSQGIECWICAQHREARQRNWGHIFTGRACWLPMISVHPEQRHC